MQPAVRGPEPEAVGSMSEQNGVQHCSPRKRPKNDIKNQVTVVLGAQWGDEGKGKVVDMLAGSSDVVCRCQVRCCFAVPGATDLGMGS